ncbi:MAG TPA: RNA methyltransferase [Usitatibacter sp.]|nr:RNA methyltransferase [Usitatibacter sp.]
MKSVTSRDNAAYKEVSRLVTSAKERKASGRSVLDGAHLVAAYLDSGRRPEAVIVNAAGLADREIAALVERASPARVTLLSDALFEALSTVDSPTGVLAVVATPEGRPAPREAKLALLLEDIQDPGNVGTLLRSAAAAGAGHVMLSAGCAFAWSPKVLRAAMGAHFSLEIAEGADLAAWIGAYRGTSIALSGRAPKSLYDLDLAKPCAFLVGNEGAGLTPALESAAAVRARIPMPGRMESLNAGTAGSIALFECVRQRTSR